MSRPRRAVPALDDLAAVRTERASETVTARAGAALTVLTCLVAVAAVPGVGLASGLTVVGLVPAALVDIDERRLPNRMVAFAAATAGAVLAVSLGIDAAVGREPAVTAMASSLATGVALMAGPLLVMHLVSPAAMGFGDVKAAAVLGAGLGVVDPQLALVALLLASALTATWGLVTRHHSVPFGPGLVVGSAWALVLSGMLVGGGA